MKSPAYSSALSWLVTLLVPVFLVLTAVRLLMTPAYVFIEYNTPNFPDDRYGFTKQDRLDYSKTALNYLLNDEGISYLADLRFPDGQITPHPSCNFMDDCTRLYNDRELKHMVDVKNVVTTAINVWIVSIFGLVGLGVWARLGGWWQIFRQGLGRGGWLTIGVLGSLLLFVFIAFGVLFVAFHNVFFDPGTWTFLYSDTLIRLFPERFWRDTFLAVGLLAGGMGLVLGVMFRREK